MKTRLYAIVFVFILIIACQKPVSDAQIEQWKFEIVKTEKKFSALAQKEGIPKAFMTYAAEDAVLMRKNSLIIGKIAIHENFKNQSENSNEVSLEWEPDFVDVSKSGDLGYTYGTYTYTVTDSVGKTNTKQGVFHTVWKRQANGEWKFVWD